VEKLKDLAPGMLLKAFVTNVTNVGTFVDIGLHQDGLVHISMLSNKFVKDPHEVVKVGEVVRVKVLELDLARKRIALTMRLDDAAPRARPAGEQRPAERGGREAHAPRSPQRPAAPQGNGMMAEELARALKR
jgi:protein Tex